eukprot:TRINITY_DN97694_c0_g1_i1.p1 TRINITY_DN97694_c0_g1~~TRINITY_DN97694_c0_g1_i1.p1  ORF type:complete len:286 (-),score=42.79 TRINITY_DN97694_c0_g1_i1:121-912(-)
MGDAEWMHPQGPVRAERDHPEWQGSISAHFIERGHGFHRGLKQVDCHSQHGVWGIAQQGLGGYMTDVRGKLEQDVQQGRRAHPMSRYQSEEVIWRPGRRSCAGPTVVEPDKISSRPAFVPRHGSFVTSDTARCLPPVYDPKVDRFQESSVQKDLRRRLQKERKEVRDAQRLVRSLDVWEGELPERCANKVKGSPMELAGFSTSLASRTRQAEASAESWKSPLDSVYDVGMLGGGPPNRMRNSASDPRLAVHAPSFCRQRAPYS